MVRKWIMALAVGMFSTCICEAGLDLSRFDAADGVKLQAQSQALTLHAEQYDIGIKALSQKSHTTLHDLAESQAREELAMIPWTPWSASLSSGCVFSGCGISGCIFSGCGASGCLGSACAASGCGASLCAGSACGGSTCAGSACGGSVCVGSDCNGSVCVGSACNGSVCQGSGCSGSACSGSSCTNSLCSNSGCDTCPPDITSIEQNTKGLVAVDLNRGALRVASMSNETYVVKYQNQLGEVCQATLVVQPGRVVQIPLGNAVELISVDPANI